MIETTLVDFIHLNMGATKMTLSVGKEGAYNGVITQ